MLDGGTEHRLDEEEQADDEEELGGRFWAGVITTSPGGRKASVGASAAVPADLLAPATEEREQRAEPGQQGDQRQRRPDQDVGGRRVVDPRLGRPVVGVGVVVSRTFGRAAQAVQAKNAVSSWISCGR